MRHKFPRKGVKDGRSWGNFRLTTIIMSILYLFFPFIAFIAQKLMLRAGRSIQNFHEGCDKRIWKVFPHDSQYLRTSLWTYFRLCQKFAGPLVNSKVCLVSSHEFCMSPNEGRRRRRGFGTKTRLEASSLIQVSSLLITLHNQPDSSGANHSIWTRSCLTQLRSDVTKPFYVNHFHMCHAERCEVPRTAAYSFVI